MGELAAWGCAGLLAPEEVLRLAIARAEAMDQADGEGAGLIALLGLTRSRVEQLCRSHGAHIAIVNGEDFFVAGGPLPGLERMRGEAGKAATILKVAVVSHALAGGGEPAFRG